MNNQYYNLSTTRFFINLLNIFALILSLASINTFFYFFFNKEIESVVDANILSYIVGPIMLILVAQIFLNITIISCVSNYSDEELVANKYIIATLSIGLSGVLTPAMLLRLPNIDSTSTTKPRFEISKFYARAGVVGGIGALIGQFIIHTQYDQFNNGNIYNFISTIIISIILLFSTINTVLFINKNREKYEDSKFLKFISFFYLIVATIALIITFINAILSLLDFISRFLNSNNRSFISMLFMLAYITLNILYVAFVWRLVYETLVGIWSKDQVVQYRVYTKLEDVKQKQYR